MPGSRTTPPAASSTSSCSIRATASGTRSAGSRSATISAAGRPCSSIRREVLLGDAVLLRPPGPAAVDGVQGGDQGAVVVEKECISGDLHISPAYVPGAGPDAAALRPPIRIAPCPTTPRRAATRPGGPGDRRADDRGRGDRSRPGRLVRLRRVPRPAHEGLALHRHGAGVAARPRPTGHRRRAVGPRPVAGAGHRDLRLVSARAPPRACLRPGSCRSRSAPAGVRPPSRRAPWCWRCWKCGCSTSGEAAVPETTTTTAADGTTAPPRRSVRSAPARDACWSRSTASSPSPPRPARSTS